LDEGLNDSRGVLVVGDIGKGRKGLGACDEKDSGCTGHSSRGGESHQTSVKVLVAYALRRGPQGEEKEKVYKKSRASRRGRQGGEPKQRSHFAGENVSVRRKRTYLERRMGRGSGNAERRNCTTSVRQIGRGRLKGLVDSPSGERRGGWFDVERGGCLKKSHFKG